MKGHVLTRVGLNKHCIQSNLTTKSRCCTYQQGYQQRAVCHSVAGGSVTRWWETTVDRGKVDKGEITSTITVQIGDGWWNKQLRVHHCNAALEYPTYTSIEFKVSRSILKHPSRSNLFAFGYKQCVMLSTSPQVSSSSAFSCIVPKSLWHGSCLDYL